MLSESLQQGLPVLQLLQAAAQEVLEAETMSRPQTWVQQSLERLLLPLEEAAWRLQASLQPEQQRQEPLLQLAGQAMSGATEEQLRVGAQ